MALTLLFGLLWRPVGPIDRAPYDVAVAMALTWGDALAALVGRRYGRHCYQIWGGERSLEGSTAMFAVSAATIFPALALLPGSSLCPYAAQIETTQVLTAALLGAGAATLAEAASPRGTDNLSVPLVAAGMALLLGG